MIKKHFFETLSYLNQLLNYFLYSYSLDKLSPKKGQIGQYGFVILQCSPDIVDGLFKLWLLSAQSGKKKYGGVILTEEYFDSIDFIFREVSEHVISYIGSCAKLDGLSWGVSNVEDSVSSISVLWHTDNVGIRLKVFVCVEGDGSQPTILRKTSFDWDLIRVLWDSVLQLPRWLGFKLRVNLKNEVHVSHRKGTLAIFDTDILHRGSYETATNRRIIFHLEFSNPEKHKNIFGPIGTNSGNEFIFDQKFLGSIAFSTFIDESRLQKEGNFYKYSKK